MQLAVSDSGCLLRSQLSHRLWLWSHWKALLGRDVLPSSLMYLLAGLSGLPQPPLNMAAGFSQGEQTKSEKQCPNGSMLFFNLILETDFFTSAKFYLSPHTKGEGIYTRV